MSHLSIEQASSNSSNLKDQVCIITGAGSGIGRSVALRFASHGAKVVLGDLDEKALDKVAKEIKEAGGKVVSARCDVTKWDDQTKLFDLAYQSFGSVDVVLPNAGVTELFSFDVEEKQNGKLSPPNLKTLDVNLYAVMHTSALALHYFSKPANRRATRAHKSLKALAITGSMSSFMAAGSPGGGSAPVYTSSKAGVLGLVNGLKDRIDEEGGRVALICPYFVQTNLLPEGFQPDSRLGFADIGHVTSAFVASCTDPSSATSGAAYTIPDNKGIWVINSKDLRPKGLSGMSKAKRGDSKL